MNNKLLSRDLGIRDMFIIFLRNAVWIIIISLLSSAAAYIYVDRYVPRTFQTRLSFMIKKNTQTTKGDTLEEYDYSGIAMSRASADTLSIILKSKRVMDAVREDLNARYESDQIRSNIDCSVQQGTEILFVTISGSAPEFTTMVGESLVKVAPDLVSTISGKCFTLYVIDNAVTPTAPVNPGMTRIAILTFSVVFFGLIALMVLKENFNVKIMGEDDIKDRMDIPVLAMLPIEDI